MIWNNAKHGIKNTVKIMKLGSEWKCPAFHFHSGEGDSGIPVTLGIRPKTWVKRRARLFEAWKNDDKKIEKNCPFVQNLPWPNPCYKSIFKIGLVLNWETQLCWCLYFWSEILFTIIMVKLTCVKFRYCARDGGGAQGSVQPGKVGLVHTGDVPVVSHPAMISDYHVLIVSFS